MKPVRFSADPSIYPTVTNVPIQAAQWLKAGQLLAYPTESVWGIGCDPFNESAVAQLLAIKQRPMDKGMIVITDSVARIAPLLATLTIEQRQPILESWQVSSDQLAAQAQTWLLPLSNTLSLPIPSWITGAHNSVAVRVIAHPLIQQLCAQMVSLNNPYGFIVSTSCNPSGQPPALSLAQAQSYFDRSDKQNINEQSIDAKGLVTEQVKYLYGSTLGYQLPSQISDALTGQVIR